MSCEDKLLTHSGLNKQQLAPCRLHVPQARFNGERRDSSRCWNLIQKEEYVRKSPAAASAEAGAPAEVKLFKSVSRSQIIHEGGGKTCRGDSAAAAVRSGLGGGRSWASVSVAPQLSACKCETMWVHLHVDGICRRVCKTPSDGGREERGKTRGGEHSGCSF